MMMMMMMIIIIIIIIIIILCSLNIRQKGKKVVKIYGALNLRANTSRNYLPRKEDGRGLISAADCHHGTVEFESICSAESENAAKSYLPHFEA